MAIVRILLILLLVGLGLLLVFQNQMPFVVTLLGTPLQALPLGILLLAAVILGFLTGILLLLLLQTRGTPRKASARRPVGPSFTPKNPFRRRQPKAVRNSSRSSAKNRTPTGSSDWHEAPSRDWTSVPNGSAYRSERAPAREPLPDLEELEFERPLQREPERVVDADYRVLRQPYSPPPPDEEWEDDFFKNER